MGGLPAMSQGFSAYNGGNHQTIDGQFRNYRLVMSGSAVTGAAVPYAAGVGLVNGVFTPPIVMVRPPNTSVIIAGNPGWYISSTQRGFLCRAGYVNGAYNPNFTYQYKVYAPTPVLPVTGTHGLRVWNASGTVVFDSREEYLNWMTYRQVWIGTGVGLPAAGDTITESHGTPPVGGVWFILSNGTYEIDSSALCWFGQRVSDSESRWVFQGFVEPGIDWFFAGKAHVMIGSAVV
jgi:hypothetical protein